MDDWNECERRIFDLIGNEDIERDEATQLWYRHLLSNLKLPCDVTGIEDFQWEEFYVVGPGSKAEYQKLRKSRPSYRDVFELIAIYANCVSEWMMFYDDLKAHVRRKTDGKQFILGLSELKATGKNSQEYKPLYDYSVWQVSWR